MYSQTLIYVFDLFVRKESQHYPNLPGPSKLESINRSWPSSSNTTQHENKVDPNMTWFEMADSFYSFATSKYPYIKLN